MEGLLILVLLVFGLIVFLAPFMAWGALMRTGRLEDEIVRLKDIQSLLSEHVDRLQARSKKLLRKVEKP